MRHVLRRWAIPAAAFLVLGSLGLAIAEDALFHTDDGCVVETHCIACLWHHGAVVVAPAVVVVAQAPAPAEPVLSLPRRAPSDVNPRTAASRGPPLA